MRKRQLLQTSVLMAVFALSVVEPIAAQEQTTTTPVASAASVDAVEKINQEMEALAVELMSSLPPTGTYAVKNANDSSSGVPEDLLAQMTSSLQTSLMVASNFSITLIDQAQLQESWANAVEFNGADFETMVGQANFDALIVLNTRATVAGLEVSLQAVGATSIDAGQILASTKLRSVNVDWNDFKSVDYSEKMSDKVLEIQKQLEALKSKNDPVSDPTTFADHYHNATVFRKNNENHKEITSLESALSIEPKFYDVLSDLIQVLVKVYGTEAASKYVEARLTEILPPEMIEYSMIMLDFTKSQEFPISIQSSINTNEVSNPSELAPLAAQWIKSSESTFIQSLRKRQENLTQYPAGEPGASKDLHFFLNAVRVVIRAYDAGEFQKQFLDTNRSYAAAEIEKMRDFEREFNQVEYGEFSSQYTIGSGLIYHVKSWRFNAGGLPIGSEMLEKESVKVEIDYANSDQTINLCNFKSKGLVSKLEIEDPRVEVKFPLKITDPSSGVFSKGDFWVEFPGLPIDASTDRIVFGDACSNEYANSLDANTIRGLHRLLITDDVDVSKSIVLELVPEFWEEGIPTYKVDISEDGTFFLKSGAPINSSNFEGFDVFPSENNKWLFAPGIIQSSLFSGGLVSVAYTDVFGIEKTIVNGKRSNLPNIRNINFSGSIIGGNYGIWNSNSVSRVGSPNASDVAIVEDEVSSNSNDSSVEGNQVDESEGSVVQEKAMADAAMVVESISRELTWDDRTAAQEILMSKGLYGGPNDGIWGDGTRSSFDLLFTALQLGGVQYNVDTPDNFISMMIMIKGFDASYFSSVIAEGKKGFGSLCDGDDSKLNCFAIRGWTQSGEGSIDDVYIGFWDRGVPNGTGVLFVNGLTLVGKFENGLQSGDMKLADSEKTLEGFFQGEQLIESYDTPYLLDVRGNNSESMMETSSAEGPSFDCDKASTTAERSICTYRSTSQADQTAADYFAVLKRARGPEVAKLVGRFFMRERDKCGRDPDCLELVLYYSAAVFHDLSLPDQ